RHTRSKRDWSSDVCSSDLQEVIPDYAGDFMILSRYEDTDLSFMKDDVWKSIPAVQKEQVIEIDTAASSYSDPTTLDYLLDLFQRSEERRVGKEGIDERVLD